MFPVATSQSTLLLYLNSSARVARLFHVTLATILAHEPRHEPAMGIRWYAALWHKESTPYWEVLNRNA